MVKIKSKSQEKREAFMQPQQQPKFRYVCHGCTKDAGHYVEPVLNARVTCPHCNMDQLTKLENFIAL